MQRQTRAVSYLSVSYAEVQQRRSTIIDLFKRDVEGVAIYFHCTVQQNWTVRLTYRQEAKRKERTDDQLMAMHSHLRVINNDEHLIIAFRYFFIQAT